MAKILVVDDDRAMTQIVRDALHADGYNVDSGCSGSEAETYMRIVPYDLVILDWELPDKSGPELAEKIRQAGDGTPILMLTARTSLADKKVGYESGADDYLTKPFELDELLMKVKAILRRPKTVIPKQLKARNIEINLNTQETFKDGRLIALLPKEYALLSFLMRHPRQVFNANALLDRVWQTDTTVGPETVRVTLMRIRQKLESPGDEPLISTIRGFGYRLDP